MKNFKKERQLFILHLPPPIHGASKVGKFIQNSQVINNTSDCWFIPIRSSENIEDIGKVSWKKVYLVIELYIKIFWALIVFRPDKIYFTASIKSVAFYRDLLVSLLWKAYKLFCSCEVYYHYHTKGIDSAVSASPRHLKLTRFFLKGVNLILLSPLLEKDFDRVRTFKSVNFLPNGAEDNVGTENFSSYIIQKYPVKDVLHLLYLSNMIKEKGYFEVLKLAEQTKGEKVHYHFAGGWKSQEDEKEFMDFIIEKGLQEQVTFHGFVSGEQKSALFEQAHLFIFPTRYPNEAFPLSVLESLSYGVPVLATDEASIPYMLDEKCGIIFKESTELYETLQLAKTKLVNEKTARYCRERFEDYFTLKQFESNLIQILKGEENA